MSFIEQLQSMKRQLEDREFEEKRMEQELNDYKEETKLKRKEIEFAIGLAAEYEMEKARILAEQEDKKREATKEFRELRNVIKGKTFPSTFEDMSDFILREFDTACIGAGIELEEEATENETEPDTEPNDSGGDLTPLAESAA